MSRVLDALERLLFFLGLLILLVRLGSPPLDLPPIGSRTGLRLWLEARDPVTVTMVGLRLAALVVLVYLLVVMAVTALARITRWALLIRVADVITVPVLRNLVGACAGVGLAASAVAVAGLNALPRPAAASPAAAPGGTGGVGLLRLPDRPEVVLRRLPDPDPDPDARDEGGTATMRVDDAPAPDAPDEAPDPPPPGPLPRTWVTEPGDHLWHISEAVLAAEWGRAPTDAEIAPYWSRVVEVNRADLPDPDNPDLIFPGEVLTIPEPPAPPGS